MTTMYQIKVINNDAELSVDMQSASFPYNFESRDIAELRDMSASWSYTIRVPRTPNNERIFDHAGTPFVVSGTPYKRMQCNVYVDGVLIIHRGVLFLDCVTRTEYEIQILSGVSDFFELIKDISFDDDLFNVRKPTTTLPNTATDGVVWRNYQVGENVRTNTPVNGALVYANPLVHAQTLLSRIASSVGYTITTNTEVFADMYLSVAKNGNIASSAGQTLYQVVAKNNASARRFAPNMVSTDSMWSNGGLTPTFSQDNSEWRCTRIRVAVFNTNNTLSDYFSSGYAITVNCGRFSTGISSLSQMSYDSAAGCYYWETDEYRLNQATTASISIEDPDGLYWADCMFEFALIQTADTDTPLCGGRFPIMPNLGIKDGNELFKLFAQLFGWLVVVDGQTKTVQCSSFKKVMQSKTTARDWSRKVDASGACEITFGFGSYARANTIQLSENKITGFVDAASFTIDNEKLDTAKTLFTIGAASGENHVINLYESQDGEMKFVSPDKPFIVRLDSSFGIANVSASDVLAYYQPFVDALTDCQVVRVNVVLSVLDILQFDAMTPVYLDQFGAFFYVNKIEQWENGKPCTVELLKI